MGVRQVHFTSDLHFGHKNIVQYTDRGVATTQEDHDEWLIQLWNKQVGIHDTVYHLGDFLFNSRDPDRLAELLNRLNGWKIFILGNHDREEIFKKLELQYHHLLEVKHNGHKMVLCHYSMQVWNTSHYGTWHLFGHSHGTLEGIGKSVDVGLDSAYKLLGEHRFFNLDDLVKIMEGKDVRTHH